MNSELKPCPFCGGEAELWVSEDGIYGVWCSNPDCYMDVDTRDRTSKEAAIEAWNTRAERTGKQVITECNDGLMPPFTAHCSECGVQWGYTPNYCPNCGVKVVG